MVMITTLVETPVNATQAQIDAFTSAIGAVTVDPVTGALKGPNGQAVNTGGGALNSVTTAVADAVTDNSTTFAALRDLLKDTTNGVYSDTLEGYRQDRPRTKKYIPGGVYRIQSPEQLGDLFATSTLYGLTIEGAGPSATIILFDPPSLYDSTGTLASSTTTTNGYKEVYLPVAASTSDNSYLGWTFTATSGAASGTPRNSTATIIAYSGASRKATLSHALVADPASGDSFGIAAPLWNSFNRYFGLTVSGISFQGTANAAKRNLFSQYSNGTAQDVMWQRCEFAGTWSTLFFLYAPLGGSGNNSETLWHKCSFTGAWQAALQTNVSDQLMNYWFANCKYWTTAPWIRAIKGSNFHIEYCDVSVFGLNNVPSDITTNPVYLFSLEGSVNSTAIFTMLGTRVECHNINARILYSAWSGGKITFASGTAFAAQTAYGATNSIMFQFDVGSFGPSVCWRDCALLGIANFTFNTESYRLGQVHAIRDCSHQIAKMPDEFIQWVAASGASAYVASHPVVEVSGWNTYGNTPNNNRMYLGNGTLNGNVAWTVSRQRLSASFKQQAGTIPAAGNPITLRIPIGSTITGAHFHIPAGASADGSARTWLILTGEATPTTLATLTATPNAGIATFTPFYWECADALKATLVLQPQTGATELAGNSQIAVDYLA